jgi:hypothetical protein
MERTISRAIEAVYHRWEPGDWTSYELIILADPHGGHRLWWRNGRSSRKGQEPTISTYWTEASSFRGRRDHLKRSMHLNPYDAEALAVFLAEKGHCQKPFPGELREFPARCVLGAS